SAPAPAPAVELAAAPLRPPAPIPNVAAPTPFRAAPSDLAFAPPRTTSVMAFAPETPPVADAQSPPSAPERMAVPRAERTGSIFGSLFHANGRNEPVSPLVASLWTTPLASPDDAPSPAQPIVAAQPAAGTGPLRDLFRAPGAAAPPRRDGRV